MESSHFFGTEDLLKLEAAALEAEDGGVSEVEEREEADLVEVAGLLSDRRLDSGLEVLRDHCDELAV